MGPVKLPFADPDLAPLIKRYSPSTIVTMLREIAKCKSAKLDWGMLCKGTATGIKNPREYQALWRSIAYQMELEESFEDNESPMDDDSDIEVELEATPAVSPAVAETISSFVKADLQQHELQDKMLEQNAAADRSGDAVAANKLQGSGLLGKPDGSAALAATTNARGVPYLASATQCAAARGESAATLSCSTSTKVPYSGVMNQSDARKRRRLWTPEEDLALIAAVDKCGEGNWTTVLKNHYEFDRSASQLSQRWALIRKRREVQEKAGYGGSGVSLLASGYNIDRPEGPKPGALAGSVSQLGTPKDIGKSGDKIMSHANVTTPIKQPLSSASTVPVSKRIPAASTPLGTETPSACLLETQRVRTLPVPGVSTSWASVPGQRPQAHIQTSMRGSAAAGASGAGQAHKGATHEGSAGGSHAHGSGVRRPAQSPSVGSQMFYSSTQSGTSTIPTDSKYAASRTMGGGVARGGSKGLHGPDPMIQAAAMAAGARIAPAATAASLLKAAQSGNVVHIGSGGLPRSKLGLSNQAGSGHTSGNPRVVHYISTGSGNTSLATASTSLQRTSSHHLAKNQSSRGLSGNSGSHPPGNSSPLAAPTMPPLVARNNPQTPVQSGKPVSSSKVPTSRGSSPQQKVVSAATIASTSASTPTSTPATTAAFTPVSTTASTSASTPVLTPASASGSTTPPTSGSTPKPTSGSTLSSKSASTSAPTPPPISGLTPPPNSASTSALTSGSTPPPISGLTPPPESASTPALTSGSTPPPISGLTPPPKSASNPASKSGSTPPPISGLTPSSKSASPLASTPASTPASIPACGFNTADSAADLGGEGTTS